MSPKAVNVAGGVCADSGVRGVGLEYGRNGTHAATAHRSTAKIAKALWITEDTVRTHVKRMNVRLGARSRSHAVAIGFREGLRGSSCRDGNGAVAV